MNIRRLVTFRCELAEGPLWDPDSATIYWVDILGKAVWRADAGGGNPRKWDMPAHIGAMALRRNGGAVVALATGFFSLDFATGRCQVLAEPAAGQTRTRFNDGKVDRRGRLLAGSMDYGERDPLGALYRLDADLGCTRLMDGFTIFNAPCWSPDGRTFYYADSARGTLFAADYDLKSGTISRSRIFVGPDVAPGAPDGATVDAEGYVWNARWGAGRVIRFTPDGRIDRTIEVPAKKTTSIAFGGPDMDWIYITSMKDPALPDDPADPESGSVYLVTGAGIKGIPEPRFAG